MRTNHVKARLRAGDAVIGTLGTTASPLMAEALGHAGFDFLIVDLQHGENNLGNLQAMLQAISASPAMPLVRLPANIPAYVQRALDLGAYGIVAPLVESRAEAEALLQSVRYAPQGGRSWGPVRGSLYGGADYFSASAEELLTIVMLETAAGLEHASEILSVDGVDGCFVGPNDLSISLGYGPELSTLPDEVERAVEHIRDACNAAGKSAGIQTYSAAAAAHRIAQGFRFVSVQSDLRMARATASDLLRDIRRSL